MTDMISATVTDASKATAQLAERQERLLVALQRKVFRLCIQLQEKIQRDLATGLYLKSRHGIGGLSGSVIVIEPEIQGTVITGSVTAGATGERSLLFYGGMWERTGHREIVPVNKQALHFFASGKEVFAKRVAAQAPRHWMTGPFKEFKPQIIAELNATVTAAGASGSEKD